MPPHNTEIKAKRASPTLHRGPTSADNPVDPRPDYARRWRELRGGNKRDVAEIDSAMERSPAPAKRAPAKPRREPVTPASSHVLQLDRRAPLVTAAHFLHQRYRVRDGTHRLIHWQDGFYHWTGTHYAAMDEAKLRSELWPFLESAFQDGEPFQPNTGKVNEVVNALKAAAYLDSSLAPPCWLHDDNSINELTYDPGEVVACRNGLLDLRSQTLLPHTPQFFTLNALDFPYAPEAPAPAQWLRFLQSLWGDDTEAIGTLQEMFGYFLTGDMRHQKAFMIIGPKRGGKGTIARILRSLLGQDNVIGPTLASLSETFGLEPLIGKRVAIVSDARLSNRADQHAIAERLLSISGEDALTIGRKFKKAWTGRLPVRFLVLSNMLPRLSDSSGALASRFILLTMQKSFFGREDHGLTDRLTKELPGILAWSLAGWSRLTRRGYFLQPKSSAEAMQTLEDLTSPIAAFIRERCAFGPGYVPVDDLFSAWVLWCNRAGTPSGSRQTFGRDLSAALPRMKIARRGPMGKQVRVYEGIELL